MGILFWFLDKPSAMISQTRWSRFLDNYAEVFVFLAVATTALVVYVYSIRAGRLRIHTVDDPFRPYTPMKSIFLVLLGALVGGVVAGLQFYGAFGTTVGLPGFASLMFFLLAILCGILSYVAIVFVLRNLTPANYRNRPAPYLYKKPATR